MSRIEIDAHYLELALNARADHLAIAGSTGFALYFRKTARWRVVRQLGDALLFCCVMASLTHDLLLVATFDLSFRPASAPDSSGKQQQSK